MTLFNKSRLLSLLAAAAAFALCISCQETGNGPDSPSDGDATLNVMSKYVGFEDYAAAERSVTVRSNRDWSFESQQEWLSGRKDGDNTLAIIVSENESEHSREGSIDVTASSSLRQTIKVTQLGWGKEIVLSATSASVGAAGGVVEVEVTTNIAFGVASDSEWVRTAASTRAHEVQTGTVQLMVDSNSSNEARTATVTFSDSDGSDEFQPRTFTIRQSDFNGSYSPTNPDTGDNEDIKVKPTGYSAPEAPKGYGISQAFDGRPGTYYRSAEAFAEADFPVEIRCDFADEQLDYFVYTPSPEESGRWHEVDIEVLTNANTRGTDEWQSVKTHDFAGTSQVTRVEFPIPLIGVKALRFNVRATADMKVSVADLVFFKNNPDNFNWWTLFTDRSCSELREGVTEDDINACRYSFYRSLAFYMLHGRYTTEFRAAAYKPRQSPDVQGKLYGTDPYSLFDNPTGMAFDEGEEITVLAELKGQQASLCVINFDMERNTPNWLKGDGVESGRKSYPLISGANRITIQEKGLAYIMYHTNDFETAPEINIHFASGGTVNGYYDLLNPAHEGRWRELLSGAKHAYFDVVGRYAHICYETDLYRNNGSNLRELIDIYDEIVFREQIFFGLMRNRGTREMYNNRLYFMVYYSTYAMMYATRYHIGVSRLYAFPGSVANASLRNDAWALAHEAGHIHQIQPFMRWGSMTEVTNNIMSMHITRDVFGNKSRLQNSNAYQSAWEAIIVPRAPHNGSGNNQLVPFWQLELYFGHVLGRTPKLGRYADDAAKALATDAMSDAEYRERYDGFYPALYESIRNYNRSNSGTSGLQYQAQFARLACEAARADLTDFFEKWGFFKDAAGKELANAAEVRGQIKDMGYDAPEAAIEYITDNNVSLYKERAQVTAGTATVSGGMLTVRDCRNAVAYEVYDSAGTLRAVAEGSETSFKATGWSNGWSLCAVQYDGKREPVKVN